MYGCFGRPIPWLASSLIKIPQPMEADAGSFPFSRERRATGLDAIAH